METAIHTHLMRLPAVKQATGIGTSYIYELMAAGDFPQPYALGKRAKAWRSDEIQDWILSRPRAGQAMEAAQTEVV